MVLILNYKVTLEKETMQGTQRLSGFPVTERTQLNAAHAQLLERFCRNLPSSNDPVVRISRNLGKIVQKRECSIQ